MCVDFRNLNKAFPKDAYHLPCIDKLVDNASGYYVLSFLDAYSGYNQILMHPKDQDKTAFITEMGNYCYKVMPFGLKNVGATYQRLMDKVFNKQIGRNLEVYIDDMVIKTKQPKDHGKDIEEIFTQLRKHNMRLNPKKCAFGVRGGKFLASSILVTETGGQQHLVYFVSKILQNAELRYKPMEKLAYTLIVTARRLRHYFQSNPIVVRTSQPIRQVLLRPETSGRLTKWSIELSEFDISYEPRTAMKAQFLADFVVELAEQTKEDHAWELYVDGASNSEGSGAGVLLTNKQDLQTEQSIRFTFKATNNQAEYEALLAGLRLAQSLNITYLQVYCDSQLIVQQVTWQFQENDWRTSYKRYLQTGDILEGLKDMKTFKRRAASYTLIGHNLYKRGFSQPLLRCVDKEEADIIMDEVHEGVCGNHIGGMILASKITRAGGTPTKNGLAEAANKVILQALKKKVGEAKGEWAKLIPELLWGYNTTRQTTTQESPVRLVYGSHAMIPVEIAINSPRAENISSDNNNIRRAELDVIEEVRDKAKLQQKGMQEIIKRKYNRRVQPRTFVEHDLVLRRTEEARKPPTHRKLAATWEGPYRIHHVLGKGAYSLQTLEGDDVPGIWNISSLRNYFV
ncbi:uncharacterized protein [Arachis hypogaea]|uniref:uncharacterized protein n=1 Tax=Arachis hypogaea TaxID=3818 RepID=UPI0007AFA24F